MSQPFRPSTQLWIRTVWSLLLLTLIADAGLVVAAPRLAQYGLTSLLSTVVLVPLGLVSAALLFGALPSHARYEGKLFGGTLRLGGPVVVFCLVVFGIPYLARGDGTFQLVVRVHGPAGVGDLIRGGSVTLDLETDWRNRPINTTGEADFSEIPHRFLGQKVLFVTDVPGYDMKGSNLRELPPNHTVYIEMAPRPRPPQTIAGLVEDASHGLAGARVSLPALGKEA